MDDLSLHYGPTRGKDRESDKTQTAKVLDYGILQDFTGRLRQVSAWFHKWRYPPADRASLPLVNLFNHRQSLLFSLSLLHPKTSIDNTIHNGHLRSSPDPEACAVSIPSTLWSVGCRSANSADSASCVNLRPWHPVFPDCFRTNNLLTAHLQRLCWYCRQGGFFRGDQAC